MEPINESSLMVGQNDLSLLSQSFVPNFIRNTEEEDQSNDLSA